MPVRPSEAAEVRDHDAEIGKTRHDLAVVTRAPRPAVQEHHGRRFGCAVVGVVEDEAVDGIRVRHRATPPGRSLPCTPAAHAV